MWNQDGGVLTAVFKDVTPGFTSLVGLSEAIDSATLSQSAAESFDRGLQTRWDKSRWELFKIKMFKGFDQQMFTKKSYIQLKALVII